MLVVCTGNVCRSPMIAAVLAGAVPGLVVASAGTSAVVGAPASEGTRTVLAARGLTADGHRARQLTRAQLEGAGLVLTATRMHRAQAVRLRPEAADAAYAMKELARLLTRVDAPAGAGLSATLAAASAALRAEEGDDAADLDDLADPIGQPLEAYERCAAEVDRALAPLISALRGAAA